MKHVLTLFLVLISAGLFAAPESWSTGVIVLKGNDVVRGEISVKTNMEVVLFRLDDKITVYPAHKIQFFFFYDEEEGAERNFVSMEKKKGSSRTYLLYETVVEGQVSVLKKERTSVPHVMVDQTTEYIYFVHWDNELMSLRKFRTKIYPRLIDAMGAEIKDYIHEHRLDPHLPSDAIQIIDFYNQRMSAQPMMAHV